MTPQNQGSSALIDQTVQALSGNPSSASPTDGASVIDSWVTTLGADSPVSSTLSELKQALQSSSPDGSEISSLLMSLSEQTQSAASSAGGGAQSSLQELAQSLKSFGQQL